MAYSSRTFVKRVRDTILKYSMIEKGHTVLVAVSGGPDSVALLHALLELRDSLGFGLAACHLDHGFRGEESAADAEFVEALCLKMGIACDVRRVDVPALMSEWGMGAEEAGRRARYMFYEDAASKTSASRVALGHTLDDQAETVLMRLIRGSGLDGLTGIPPVRGMYIRPLLYVSRREVEKYCAATGAAWRTDSTNQEPLYFRNQVRLQLVPCLERWNPRLREILSDTADRLREDASYLDLAGRATTGRLARRENGRAFIARDRFNGLHPAMKRYVLRALAREIYGESAEAAYVPLGYGHVEAIISLAESGSPVRVLHLPGGMIARLGACEISLERTSEDDSGPAGAAFPVPIRVPGTTEVEGLGIRIRAEVQPASGLALDPATNRDPLRAFIDNSLIEYPLMVRSRMDGDYFYPLGMSGRKKIGDFMTSLKVPVSDRPYVPIVLSRDRVVWVGGYRLDERFKVTRATTQVLLLAIEEKQHMGGDRR